MWPRRPDRSPPPGVAEALASVDRAAFLPPGRRDEAARDRAVPIACGQTCSQPSLVGQMCALLELGPDDRVLDVGTGSGFHAAVLSRLAGHVWSVERHPELADAARTALAAAGCANVTVLVGDGARGLPARAPFDAVNVAATATRRVPPALVEQLAPGGRLVAPVSAPGGEHLHLLRKAPDGTVRDEVVTAVRFVPLVEGGP